MPTTSTIDPYKVLGVSRRATPAQVQRAYRKRAMQCHPDRGGDAEEFRQVQLAYEVLSDSTRRTRYDQTGDLSEGPSQSQSEANAVMALRQVYVQVLNQLVSCNRQVSTVDLIPMMREAVRTQQSKFEEQRRAILKVRETIKQTLGRFSVKGDGENYLQELAKTLYEQGEVELANLKKQSDIGMDALALLDKFTYRVDQQSGLSGIFSGAASAHITFRCY